jgi:hypothetical protein
MEKCVDALFGQIVTVEVPHNDGIGDQVRHMVTGFTSNKEASARFQRLTRQTPAFPR